MSTTPDQQAHQDHFGEEAEANRYGRFDETAFTAAHWRALDAVSAALTEAPDGVLAIVGPVGSAREAVADRLAADAPSRLQIVRFSGHAVSGPALIEALCAAVGAFDAAGAASPDAPLSPAEAFRGRLRQLATMKAGVVALVEGAERLAPDALALLAGLSAVSGDESDPEAAAAALRVVLVGEPVLVDHLSRAEAPELRRAAASAHALRYASPDESRALGKRLARAAEAEADPQATEALHEATRGAPALLGALLSALRGELTTAPQPRRLTVAAVRAAAERTGVAAAAASLPEIETPPEEFDAALDMDPEAWSPATMAARPRATPTPIAPTETEADPDAATAPAPLAADAPPSLTHRLAAIATLGEERGPDATTLARLGRITPGRRRFGVFALSIAAAAVGVAWIWAGVISSEIAAGRAAFQAPNVAAPAQARLGPEPGAGAPIDTADSGAVALFAAATRSAAPGPTPAERFTALMGLVERRMAAEQYTRPSEASAYAALLDAERIDPGAPSVSSGFERLVDIYRAAADRALADRRFDDFHFYTGLIDRIRERRPL